MESIVLNHRDVAMPDANASGTAGTGQEYPIAAESEAACAKKTPGRRGRMTICLGVLCTGEPDRACRPVARTGRIPDEEPALGYGNPAFPLTGGLEQISVRLDKKIDRQSRRLDTIQERGYRGETRDEQGWP